MPEFPIVVVELGILHWNGSIFFEHYQLFTVRKSPTNATPVGSTA